MSQCVCHIHTHYVCPKLSVFITCITLCVTCINTMYPIHTHYVCHELSVCVSCQLYVGILALNVHTVDWEIFTLKIICVKNFLLC